MHRALVDAAVARGWKVVERLPFVPLTVTVKRGRRILLSGHRAPLNLGASLRVTTSKRQTNLLLGKHGVPVPPGITTASVATALAFQREIGAPVVVKPVRGSCGRGVSLNVRGSAAMKRAILRAQEEGSLSRRVLVEAFVPGNDYRVFVLDGEVVARTKRVVPTVIGDGVSTLETLIERARRARVRRIGAATAKLRALKRDTLFDAALAAQRLTLASIPAKGRVVTLRLASDLSAGGYAHAVDQLPRKMERDAVRAAALLGLRVAGVDFLAEEDARGIPKRWVVNEVNGSPMFAMHIRPDAGTPVDVPGMLLDAVDRSIHLFPRTR